jgi:transposase InsO family protein
LHGHSGGSTARGDPGGDRPLAGVGRAQGLGLPAARVRVDRVAASRVAADEGARPGAASAPERREALPRGHVAVPDSNRRWATDLTTQAVFGQPRQVPDGLELRSDHGPQYTGADAEAVCQRWHVLHTFAPVARPTGNAVAERVIQTLKVELLWTRDWESIAELEQAIVEWVDRYNHQRPHQALDWRTPAQQRAINLNAPLERAA